jgi:NAD(P)-dependent dehydrogenase (short-subunit alcohol dehydrogenase family)
MIAGSRPTERPAVTVVSGAGSGIGRAVVADLLDRGLPVVGIDIDGDTLSEIAETPNFVPVVGDVVETQTWASAIEVSRSAFQRPPTQLVSNAAVVLVGTVLELSDEAWQRTFDVNLMGAVRGIRANLPAMLEARDGRIVTVASVDAFMAEQLASAYCASKGALLQLTRVVAMDYARRGVRANCICPGVTDTPLLRRQFDRALDPLGVEQGRIERQPIGRLLTPTDIAGAVVFLLSDAASGITGAMIPVDGGISTSFDFSG